MPSEVPKDLGPRTSSFAVSGANESFDALDLRLKWLDDGKKHGDELGLYKPAGETKTEQKVLPVFHKFMAKFLEEDIDGNISMLGTIIQQVCGISLDTGKANTDNEDKGNDFKFDKFRVNDVGATPEVIELRREVPVPHFGTRATYNCNIPMQKTSVFNVPPYEVFEVKCLIELQTSSHSYTGTEEEKKGDAEEFGGFDGKPKTKTCEVRPDIYINPKDERELFVVRREHEINNTDSYEMVCNAPRVRAEYDKKKEYCPKYNVSWYLEKPPGSQIVTTFAPLLFTALLACLNVVNAEGAGPALDNSIALCLTIVFVLPNLRVVGRGHVADHPTGKGVRAWLTYIFEEYLLCNNAIVFFFFLGLGFTSVAHPFFFDESSEFIDENPDARGYAALTGWYKHINAEHNVTDEKLIGVQLGYAERFGLLGMISFLFAHIIPVVNYIRYFRFKQKIVNSAYVQLGAHGAKTFNIKGKGAEATDERLAFAKDKSFDQWEMNDNALGAVAKQKAAAEKAGVDPLAELTEKIAAMDSVTNVYKRLSEADKSEHAAAATTVWNSAFVDGAPPKPPLSPMWKLTTDEPGKPHLVCGPTHE